MIRSKIAAPFRRATTMGIFWAWLMLALHLIPGAVAPVHAQGTRKDDIVFNSRGIPLAGATVRVCAQPATGQPCSPLANIYSDPLLSQALANPTTTDGMGNYFFYAAPGTYEVEISGPQISTKQIPDVILPSNPSSPTFSGAVSAFSLSLSGNLSVTGNTTVIGNFASGTVNLSNQSTPPGAASAGTVNLYTKTADKRLYYKDETGTEIGPLASGSGAQLNVANTFTAPQNIGADFHTKGPNPSADISLFGAYFGSFTPPAITCNTTSGNANISCGGGVSDFLVGHGVSIPGAGATPTVLTPGAAVGVSSMSINGSNVATITTSSSVSYTNGTSIAASGMTDSTLNGTYTNVQMTGYGAFTASFTHAACGPCSFGGGTFVAATPGAVTPIEQTGGSTSYNYKVVARDFTMGLSAASAPYSTTVGMATLGVQSYTIAANGCVTSGGQTIITTTAAHNIPNLANIEFNISPGTTGTPQLEGQFVTVSTTATTLTMNMQSFPNGTYCPSGGTLQVVAKNLVQWIPQPSLTTGHWIYRCIGPLGSTCASNSAYSRIAAVVGTESAFVDWGEAAVTLSAADAAYVPAAPPPAPVNGILATTITAISGTTVTLANNPGASLTGATVLHDDAEAIMAACNLYGAFGAEVYVTGAIGGMVLNSPLNLKNCVSTQPRITFGAQARLNEPIIAKTQTNFSGSPLGTAGATSSFQTNFQSAIFVGGFPGFLLSPINGLTGVSFHNLNIQAAASYQNAVYFDQDTGGNNVVVTTFENTSVSGAEGSQPMRIGGGFGLYVSGGFWGVSGVSAGQWGFPTQVLDTVNRGFGQNSQQLGGIWQFTETNFGGCEFYWDAAGQQLSNQASGYIFTQPLLESGVCPMFHFNTGSNLTYGVTIIDPTYADPLGFSGTPLIELGNSRVIGFKVSTTSINVCGSANQPLFAAVATTYVLVENSGCAYLGLASATLAAPGGVNLENSALSISGTGQAAYAMSTPAAPTVSISGASGPSANTYYYSVVAIDVNGTGSPVSQNSAPITVNGSQGVLVTLPAYVIGQVATTICRSTSVAYATGVCATPGAGYQITGTTFLDNGAFFPSVSANTYGGGGATILGAAGLSSSTLVVPGSTGAKDSISGTYTANRVQLLPDVSGTIVASSYLNSAFDNATRANGAIGSNWTSAVNSLNISGNAFVGNTSAAHNIATWSASTFSKYGQFAEVTVLTLNGTSDFIGPVVMFSGTTGYNCIEDSTGIFLQRFSGSSGTNLSTTSITGAAGDVLRLDIVEPSGALTCYRNGASVLTATDTTYTSGAPGLDMFNTVATSVNWTGGNLHPLNQLDVEADYTKVQHLNAGVGLGLETFTASPRSEQNVFLPGALSSTWTGATWTTDKAVTVTRVQVQAKTAPAGCTTNAIVRLTDGTSPVNLTIAAAANDSGPITQNYAAGAALTVSVQTAAAGCTTSPADANVVVQYRMQ